MKIIVKPHEVEVINEAMINENEYKINKCFFEFTNEFPEDLTKIALFTKDDKTYKEIILNNECEIPTEVLENDGLCMLGVYVEKIENGELSIRYSPTPDSFLIVEGSYKKDAENSKPITPDELEQYQQALQDAIDELNKKAENGDFDGKDAVINGVNTLQIIAGNNIELEQDGNVLTISSSGSSGGTSNYTELGNKPSINNIELDGNKTLKELGIQPEGEYLTDIPSDYKTQKENDELYQPKGNYLTAIPDKYVTTEDLDKAIQTAIGDAIGGEY